MLRIIQNTSAAGAKSYYSTADYYTEGQELTGQWRGEGARRLGLFGDVQKQDWGALCDNQHPQTGKTLTLRQKEHRRIGYDFNFHVPKSVSVLYAMTEDERLLDAFRDSVHETMQDIESEMKTRVRKGGKNEDRTTGNMVWGEFIHTTSRPVDGVPDPHLHAHCFVFNVTFDRDESVFHTKGNDVKSAWRAGQFGDLKRDAPYFEALFHSRFAQKLTELGLDVERTKTGWELAGLEKETLAKFSRRTAQIEEEAQRKGITDPQQKAELGAKTRAGKAKNLSPRQLQEQWQSRLDAGETDALGSLAWRMEPCSFRDDPLAAKEAVQASADHGFERKSVVPERTLLADALKRSVGKSSAETVQHQFQSYGFLTANRDGRRMTTTHDVLAEERSMLSFARRGRGTCRAFKPASHEFQRTWLNAGQRKAVEHVLRSRDRVVLIRGAAGVGKTTMMQETVEAIEESGTKVFTFAPSASASRGTLRQDGFREADTVARLLQDEKLHQQIQGQALWIDEAGLLGTRTTARVFQLADRLNARVILSGDRRQHGSVERGAALRLLEEEAGVIPSEIKDIQRQKGSYKQAIQALSDGNTLDGFHQLDELGWIREVTELDRYRALATDYVDAVHSGKTALVVSPTHLEADRITTEIRQTFQQQGRLGMEERSFSTLHNAQLTEAERADAVNVLPGDVLVFHQNAKGFQKGQRVMIGDEQLPATEAARYQVFHQNTISLAAGDTIRITQNGKTADGKHRLNNGSLHQIKDFDAQGNIVLNNGWTVSKEFGFIDYGYVVTFHASQGMTVDRVFVAQSSDSYPASSCEQFYVSCSRGREAVTVYTDDKEALLEAVRQSDERLSATELVAGTRSDHRVRSLMPSQQWLQQPVHTIHPQRQREELVYDR